MNKDDVIRMAREAGMRDYCDSWTVEDDPTRKQPKQIHTNDIAIFAALVADAEREACAALCEKDGLLWGKRYAAAIRAKGQA